MKKTFCVIYNDVHQISRLVEAKDKDEAMEIAALDQRTGHELHRVFDYWEAEEVNLARPTCEDGYRSGQEPEKCPDKDSGGEAMKKTFRVMYNEVHQISRMIKAEDKGEAMEIAALDQFTGHETYHNFSYVDAVEVTSACPAYGGMCPFGQEPEGCRYKDSDGDGSYVCQRAN